MRAEEREAIADQVVFDRNVSACPRREALVSELGRAMEAMHGKGWCLSEEGRYSRLRFWWELLVLTDCEIDEATEKEARALL